MFSSRNLDVVSVQVGNEGRLATVQEGMYCDGYFSLSRRHIGDINLWSPLVDRLSAGGSIGRPSKQPNAWETSHPERPDWSQGFPQNERDGEEPFGAVNVDSFHSPNAVMLRFGGRTRER